ncbi:MAG: hypothetical protein E6K84_01640 [Thaumarchaeota archaeon]|nr:MAG: hypothetical protein E6K89_01220 [Nitrososphaerota archaeon]TLY14773.1 MAG: hypothetical protein E6K84_01640 [Nitrososphaerota archaeon]
MAEEPDDRFKAVIVSMILDSKPEAALEALSRRYRVDTPRLGVGVFKRHSKGVRAVYSPERREILAAKREFLYDPFVILHEFYHHIRSVGGKHRGTEKNADRFAVEYIRAFNSVVARLRGARQT